MLGDLVIQVDEERLSKHDTGDWNAYIAFPIR